jgi:FkbM family methyltransferase
MQVNTRTALLVTAAEHDEDILYWHLAWHFACGVRQFVVSLPPGSSGLAAEVSRFSRACEPAGARVEVLESADAGGGGAAAAVEHVRANFAASWILSLKPEENLYLERGDLDDLLDRAEGLAEEQPGVSPGSPLLLGALRFSILDHVCTVLDRPSETNPLARMAYRWLKPRPGSKSGAIAAAKWSADLTLRYSRVWMSDGSAPPAIDASALGAHIRRFQIRGFGPFLQRLSGDAPPKEATGPDWARWRAMLMQDGRKALRPVFEQNRPDAAQLVHDPLPDLIIDVDGAVIDRGAARRRPFHLAPKGPHLFAIGGRTFAAEEISLRAPPAPHPVRLRLSGSDAPTFGQVFTNLEYAIDLPREPAYIMDLGANIGLATVYFAGRFPSARIACVEPDAENFRMLKANVAPYDGVRPFHAAVWPDRGALEIVDTKEGGAPLKSWAIRVRPIQDKDPGRAAGGQIPAMTIPDIMEQAGFPRIDLLKVDIEGAELELFSRNTESWIDFVDALVIETHDRLKPGCTEAVESVMGPRGFVRLQSGENLVFLRGRERS